MWTRSRGCGKNCAGNADRGVFVPLGKFAMLAQNSDHGSLFRPVRGLAARTVFLLESQRIAAAHHVYAARRVPTRCMRTLLADHTEPAPGDLLLARVESVGRFDYAQVASCRTAPIREGDEIVVCYAQPDPEHRAASFLTRASGAFDLVDPAGIATRASSRNFPASGPTRLAIIGRLGDDNGKPLNIAEWAIPSGLGLYVRQPIIAVVGERRLPGESCRTVDLVRGLAGSGFSVGVANLTGVSGCWKIRLLQNAGAREVLDITDAGQVEISGQNPEAFERIFLILSGYLTSVDTDVMVMEIEQDVFGHDAAAIVSLPSFQSRVSTIVLQEQSGTRAELERDSLRALGYDVTVVGEPGQRNRYHRMI
ncbi:MAG: hypothetical protein DWQ08_07895 [Proteobacteria bacterium]|nr:MAG: hypothetical protein DWQ08_07895 [Pseudomonadota bacterium]